MRAEGVPCDERNIAVTAGSQQALDLLGKAMLTAGDRVVVQRPTYLGALQAFNVYEPDYEELEAFLERGTGGPVPTPKLLYLVADSANPTGMTLPLAARRQALAAARASATLVVEDGAYRALQFGPTEPTLLALDCEDVGSIEAASTVFCGSLSKILCPALRCGWICGPSWLIDQVTLLQQGADVQVSTLNQVVAEAVLSEGLEAHLDTLRAAYAERAQAMHQALRHEMPDEVVWTRPAGGFFTWVTLPPGVDAAELLQASLQAGVAFVPGLPFFARDPEPATCRLSYSMLPPAEIWTAVRRLAQVLATRTCSARPALTSQ
jgi:DNA-binding transcriptional MocR family regulator